MRMNYVFLFDGFGFVEGDREEFTYGVEYLVFL
jgi:hypothetical protein